jgi:NAD(P)-dependent dehydrogenase (short-subunit alcohol dehydrogenase family)
VAIAFSNEGANVAIVYLDEHDDAKATKEMVQNLGRRCVLIAGDVGEPQFCADAVSIAVEEFGRLDILVNNAAEQHPQESLLDITPEQLERTFRTNIFSYFYMAREALNYMQPGSVIINTSSVTAYRGSSRLVDYASTKAAIVGFTRSLGLALADKGIRVNGVAPGPIWTPLIPSTFEADDVATFGSDVPMHRAGQPEEVAPSFVFLASSDSSYMTGQMLHPNGGEVVNA